MVDNGDPSETAQGMMLLYKWLRDEIDQSNRLQNQIVFGQASAVGLTVGLKYTLTSNNSSLEEAVSVLILFLPVLIVVSTGIWLLEQARVMQAGNYLQLLEGRINRDIGAPVISWESWLRRSKTRCRLHEKWYFDSNRVYELAFIVGYPLFFLLLGTVSLLLLWTSRIGLLSSEGLRVNLLLAIYSASIMVIIILFVCLAGCQISHRWHDMSEGTDQFDNWLGDQFPPNEDDQHPYDDTRSRY